jgi:peptidoglycan hydrolase-like protein with peptidoglycan-binding domain
MATQARQTETAKKVTTTVKTSTASDAPTGQPVQTAPPVAPKTSRPAASARSGIRMNGGLVLVAYETGNSSRAVKAIQYALADRGFDPGTRSGYYDQGTKNAYAAYQKSIGESVTGVPTDASLDYLGFDIIG